MNEENVFHGAAVLKAFGISQEKLESKITAIKETYKNTEISVERNLLDVKITFKGLSHAATSEAAEAAKEFFLSFPENVYAEYDASLQDVLVYILKLGKLKISVAESFTGGNLSARIISVPGASNVFYEGVVAYDSEAKIKRLNVSEEAIRINKPVSSQVAGEMAKGLLSEEKSDIVLSTTGLAGPNTDESGFPVGLCYIAVGTAQGISVYRYKFEGNRAEITEKGVQTALFLAIKSVKNI